MRKIAVILLALPLAAAACWFLTFGTALLCCSPRSYRWRPETLLHGSLALLLGLALFVTLHRLTKRTYRHHRIALVLFTLLAAAFDFHHYRTHRWDGDNGITRNWNPTTSTFHWGRGELRLPPGYQYAHFRGFDTLVGSFHSPDGRLTIEHDIGELAAEHLGLGRPWSTKDGARILLARTPTAALLSFPDTGCANFYLESDDPNDLRLLEQLAQTYRPHTRLPGWVLPLLPAPYRLDCRYRYQLPFLR